MSLNWVMLDPKNPQTYTPLPHEKLLYKTTPRASLSLNTPNPFPAAQPFSTSCPAGTLFLTNQRIIFISAKASAEHAPSISSIGPAPTSTANFQSFSAPILNLEDSRLSFPWIGPNVWTVAVRAVPGGNLLPNLPNDSAAASRSWLELKITFKDGGAYEFQTLYERLREQMSQAAEVARDSGRGGHGTVFSENLEDLPAYSGPVDDQTGAAGVNSGAAGMDNRIVESTAPGPSAPAAEPAAERNQETLQQLPDEPPPDYDEVQRQVIEDEFTKQLRESKIT